MSTVFGIRTGGPPWPSWRSAIAIAVVTAILPGREVRERYREELAAEFFGLAEREQQMLRRGMLRSAPSLRRSVGHHSGERVAASRTTRPHHRTSVRCLIGLHDLATLRTEDGGRYQRCRRCDTDYHGPTSSPGDGVMASTQVQGII